MSNCAFVQLKAAIIILHFLGWPAVCSGCFRACNSLRQQAQSMWSRTPKSHLSSQTTTPPFRSVTLASSAHSCFNMQLDGQSSDKGWVKQLKINPAVAEGAAFADTQDKLLPRTLSLFAPSPTTLNTAAGSRNTSSLPDWHIRYSLSFTSKQSCTLAFEKVTLRNLPSHPSPRSCFRHLSSRGMGKPVIISMSFLAV